MNTLQFSSTTQHLPIAKYHGTGNDFILFEAFTQTLPDFTSVQIQRLCDRHLGIGADGLMCIIPDEHVDFRMLYFNADGMPGSLCGNGGRCAVRFAADGNIISEHKVLFSAYDGLHEALWDHESVTLKMAGNPLILKKGPNQWFTDTGSPHHVEKVDQVNEVDVFNKGIEIRNSQNYKPGGTNVNFISWNQNRIQMRTFERGVENETLSCGTGVVAAALVVASEEGINGQFDVHTPGGDLQVHISPDRKDLWLKGPAIRVFQGSIDLNTLSN
jgi:diaminopimelate epimerase